MRYLMVCVALTLSACGGGGGGGGEGGGGGGSALPLTTSVVTYTRSAMTYSVTGTYEDGDGTGGVSGTMSVSPLSPTIVNGVSYGTNSQSASSFSVGGTIINSSARSYGDRFDALGVFSQGAQRLGDGTDVYWAAPIASGPTTYAIGLSWNLDQSPTPDLLGYENGTNLPRLLLSEYRWAVVGTDVVTVAAGSFECYVVSVNETVYDGDTGIESSVASTMYVRPEIGVLVFEESLFATDGVDFVTLSLTGRAN